MLVLFSTNPGMPHKITTNLFSQEVIALHVIITAVVEFHMYHMGWVKTIKIVKI